MSCSICGSLQGCNCSPNLCGSQDCPDPGLIPIGAHLSIRDYKFCDRRLENTPGILVCDYVPGGTPQIFFTNSPCIEFPIIELQLGDEISHMLASMGPNGCMRRLVPAAGTDGWLRLLNGAWQVSALPTETIPDPFQTSDLIVTETATIEDLVVENTLCAPNLPAGTITDFIGLNVTGCFVKGTISQIEAALYYESASLVSAATPNSPVARNTNVIIGNEIFDPQSIASIVTTTRIKIDKAGSYAIWWSGWFDVAGATNAANGDSSLDLVINSSIVALGCGRAGRVNPPATVPVTGFHLATLAVNDTIEIKTNATSNLNNNLLSDVKLMLVKYRT